MTSDQIETLKTLWCIGEKVAVIAEELKVSQRWVKRMKRRLDSAFIKAAMTDA